MLNAFWQGIAGALAKQWVSRVFAPAFVFWAGGFLCLVWRNGWDRYKTWWLGLDEGKYLLVIAAALIGVAVSAAVVQRMQNAVLRILEGYWPAWLSHPSSRKWLMWLSWPRRWMVERQNRILAKASATAQALYAAADVRFQQLPAAEQQALLESGGKLDLLTAAESDRLVEAETRIRNAPLKERQRMPTALGNILRAAERRPRERYGLEIMTVWPRLWLLLPEQTREDVSQAWEGLNAGVRIFTWGVLFVLLSFVAWWAFIPGLVVAFYAYRWALVQARTYSDLLEASFDVHRFILYKGVRWQPPAHTDRERAEGERLTRYLYRGFVSPGVDLIHPPDKKQGA